MALDFYFVIAQVTVLIGRCHRSHYEHLPVDPCSLDVALHVGLLFIF